MRTSSPSNSQPLSAWQLFKEYLRHTLLTVGIFLVLVLATMLLHYFAHLMEHSPFHHKVLVSLEYCIFILGSFVFLLIMFYVTFLTARDLIRNFRKVIQR